MSVEVIFQGIIALMLICLIIYLYQIGYQHPMSSKLHDFDLTALLILCVLTFYWILGIGPWLIIATALTWVLIRLLVIHW